MKLRSFPHLNSKNSMGQSVHDILPTKSLKNILQYYYNLLLSYFYLILLHHSCITTWMTIGLKDEIGFKPYLVYWYNLVKTIWLWQIKYWRCLKQLDCHQLIKVLIIKVTRSPPSIWRHIWWQTKGSQNNNRTACIRTKKQQEYPRASKCCYEKHLHGIHA